MALLLRNGRVVDPSVGLDAVCDVADRATAGSSRSARTSTIAEGRPTVDCTEKIVAARSRRRAHAPARARPRGQGDVESGTRAAAHGGFTAVCAMPNTDPVADEGAAIRFLVERAAERGNVRVLPDRRDHRRPEGRGARRDGRHARRGRGRLLRRRQGRPGRGHDAPAPWTTPSSSTRPVVATARTRRSSARASSTRASSPRGSGWPGMARRRRGDRWSRATSASPS